MGDERYERILAELQARSAARSGAPPIVPQAPAQPSGEQAQTRPRPQPIAPQKPVIVAAAAARGSVLQGLLEDGNSLLRAVVAAELLSLPLALRESTNWQIKPRNNP